MLDASLPLNGAVLPLYMMFVKLAWEVAEFPITVSHRVSEFFYRYVFFF